MGLISVRLMRRAAGQGSDHGGGGLDTTAQIAIGVIVPIIVLLGGLVFFIWRTESRRRQAIKGTEDVTHPSRLHDFLRRKDAMRGSRLIDSPQLEKARPEMDHTDRHELGDTSFMHELEDAGSPVYEINKPLPTHPPRKDSAINQQPLAIYEAPARPQRYSTAALPARKAEAGRQSTASSNYRHSTVGTIRYSTTIAAAETSRWRGSLQPTSLLGLNKRDRRVSKAASSRYSTQNFDMMTPPNRRSDGSQEEGKRSDDSSISPPVSAIEENGLSRQPSQNQSRVSAVRTGNDSPSWMKRLSVQDTVNQKWKGSGELCGPEDHKI